MKNNKILKMSCTLLLVPVFFTVASAATSHVSGGTWNHGTTGAHGGGTVYSNYYHKAKRHYSSVINYQGKYDRDNAAKSKQSLASLPAQAGEVDHAYYGFY